MSDLRPIKVSLTPAELRIAALVGVERNISALIEHRQGYNGAEADRGWQYNLEGTAGEMAVAKWADRYWSGNFGDLKADDVGDAQVRTRSSHRAQLMLFRKDKPDRAYILATGLAPHFVLRGWCWGCEGMREEYWCDPTGKGRPAFFVADEVLRPMRDCPVLPVYQIPAAGGSAALIARKETR